jgi:ubiquinone/menaquinone biosynthesis C-methylase UbiE
LKAPFDDIASAYDSHFTHSRIGQLQRQFVWSKMEDILPQLQGIDVLELNCGTGEDALLFGNHGFSIVATDVSHEMLKMLETKVKGYSLQHKISSRYLDLTSFDSSTFDKKFDLVFSNFGGINCIAPESLQRLMKQVSEILKPGGEVIAVVMPKFCWMESLYFLVTLQFSKVFRRRTSQSIMASIGEESIPIWYYNPSQIVKWSAGKFELVKKNPVGFFVPPSYLESFFKHNKRILSVLSWLESKISNIGWLSGWSDHYIIELRLR